MIPVFLLIILVVMIAGCFNASSTKPDWAHDVNWMGEKPDSIVDTSKKYYAAGVK